MMKGKKSPPLIVQATEIEALRYLMTGKPSPLRHLMAHGMIHNPQDLQSTPEEIQARLLSYTLNDVVREIENVYAQRAQPKVPAELVADCFAKLREHLARPVREVVTDEGTRKISTHLLDRKVGETTLGDYCRTEDDLAQWRGLMRDTLLIARAKQGDEQAFNELWSSHQKQVRGFIRGKSSNDDDCEEICGDTWLLLREKMPTHDLLRGAFEAFAKYWAGIALLRYYDARKKWGKVTDLFSELEQRFAGLEQEPAIEELLPRLAPEAAQSSTPSPETIVIRLEAYEKALRLTFGSCSPPHQLIVFGFVKLLEMKPQEVVTELSETPLRELAERLEKEYLERSQLPESRVRPHFLPLYVKLEKPFPEVVTEPKTLETYPKERFPWLYDRPTGATTLGNYYTGETPIDHADNVSKWCYAVKRRVCWTKWQEEEQGRPCKRL